MMSRHSILLAVSSAILVACLLTQHNDAVAYPQYQLSRGQTCTECHVSPSGGGLLTEQGMVTAESESKKGHAPEFLYGVWTPPSWLRLGGDFRLAGGAGRVSETTPLLFPMQTDLYAQVTGKGFTLHLQGGGKGGEPLETTATSHLQSREHYLMWQQNQDDSVGLFVRAGKFMPVFGLRIAEHPSYTRRYGGTQLFSEAYGVAAEYIQQGYEVHVTGFAHDLLRDSVDRADGVAVYAEKRLTETSSVGAESKYARGPDDTKIHAGVTAKHYFDSKDVLLQGEVQGIRQTIKNGGFNDQVVGNLMATWIPAQSWMVDVGLNYFKSNVRQKGTDRQALDLQLRWFWDSHLEFLASGRLQAIERGNGGPFVAYGLLQAHFRL
jgi:hypothetical protein